MGKVLIILTLACCAIGLSACRTTITAQRLSPSYNGHREPAGIPFYAPKPYIMVSKNVRYIATPTTGLSNTVPIPNTFDSSMGELNMTGSINQTRNATFQRTKTETTTLSGSLNPSLPAPPVAVTPPAASDPDNSGIADGQNGEVTPTPQSELTSGGLPPVEEVPSDNPVTSTPSAGGQVFGPATFPVIPTGSIPDGLSPETFYTFTIVYLPDLSQKYGLKIKQGMGESRATMNLVNGWMNTGPGPMYMRDSTTGSTIAAAGLAAGNVLDSIAGLAVAGASGPGSLPLQVGATPQSDLQMMLGTDKLISLVQDQVKDFAKIWLFEPVLDRDGQVDWRVVTGFPVSFDRDIVQKLPGN